MYKKDEYPKLLDSYKNIEKVICNGRQSQNKGYCPSTFVKYIRRGFMNKLYWAKVKADAKVPQKRYGRV